MDLLYQENFAKLALAQLLQFPEAVDVELRRQETLLLRILGLLGPEESRRSPGRRGPTIR